MLTTLYTAHKTQHVSATREPPMLRPGNPSPEWKQRQSGPANNSRKRHDFHPIASISFRFQPKHNLHRRPKLNQIIQTSSMADRPRIQTLPHTCMVCAPLFYHAPAVNNSIRPELWRSLLNMDRIDTYLEQ